ncbi:MAG: hypothetical protein AAF411_09390 [Myxococcota bacterium]
MGHLDRFWCFAALMLGVFAAGCGDDAPQAVTEREATPNETPSAPLREPGFPLLGDEPRLRAPRLMDHLVPRFRGVDAPYANLAYEAANVDLRGERRDTGMYADTGEAIATRWRESAARVRRLLVVRDALFSQQDHPIDHSPVSVMMPPNWVSVAVYLASHGETIDPVQAPALDDDAAWAALRTPAELFGSFPPSERLHREATKPRTVMAPERLRVTNARRTISMLAAGAATMVVAAGEGADAVARAGAEAIAESDVRYFGRRLRREHVVLVGVQNPTLHERVDEAKGFRPPRLDLDDASVETATRAVLRERLRHGDIGIERVDIGRRSERRAMIALLESLIPHGESGDSQVWLYVHGGMRGNAIEDVLPRIYGFGLQLEAANIERSRLRVFPRPPVPIGGDELALRLFQASRRFRNHDLPLALNLGSGILSRLFEELRPRIRALEERAESD